MQLGYCCSCGTNCLGCSGTLTTWVLDFSTITYLWGLTDSQTYSYDAGIACPNATGVDIVYYAIDREWPDLTNFGNSNVLVAENTPACTWGFSALTGYVQKAKDRGSPTHCVCNPEESTYLGSVTVSPTTYAAITSPSLAYLATANALHTSDCGDAITCSQDATTSIDCTNHWLLGYAALLDFPVGKIRVTLRWFPKALCTSNVQYSPNVLLTQSAVSYTPPTSDTFAWSNCWYLAYPGASSAADLDTSSIIFEKAFTCSDMNGSPITLTMINQTATLAWMHAHSMTGIPTTLTVTPS